MILDRGLRSSALETQSVIAFAAPGHFPNPRDHACPKQEFASSAKPAAGYPDWPTNAPCEARATNQTC